MYSHVHAWPIFQQFIFMGTTVMLPYAWIHFAPLALTSSVHHYIFSETFSCDIMSNFKDFIISFDKKRENFCHHKFSTRSESSNYPQALSSQTKNSYFFYTKKIRCEKIVIILFKQAEKKRSFSFHQFAIFQFFYSFSKYFWGED